MGGSESSKLIKKRKASFAVSAANRQKGAYAIEFAFVFIIFFTVLYGIITYGLIFAAQQSLNFAAESGARAGLQWQAGTSVANFSARANRALAIAKDQANWVDQMAGGNKLKLVACSVQLQKAETEEAGLTVQLLAYPDANKGFCSLKAGNNTDLNKFEVVIHYPYSDVGAQLVPYILPSSIMHVAIPNALQGRSLVDLGIALDRAAGG